MADKYKVYVEGFNKIATKAGRLDETPMSMTEFANAYGVMYESTRDQKMSATRVIDRLVKADLEYVSHAQAQAASKANKDFDYAHIRYNTEFWDIVEEEYKKSHDRRKIARTYFGSL